MKNLIFLSILCLCGSFNNAALAQESQQTYTIVTTIGMITDIVAQVAGGRAQVRGLIGPGIDPHLYKPTRSDIATLMSADVIFYNGLLLEGKMTDALIRVATAGKKVFPVTELIAPEQLLEPEDFAGHYDPHVWMDPSMWQKAVVVVRDALMAFDAAGSAEYKSNAARYLQELADLDAKAHATLQTVPEQARVLVTAHDAFNYFGKRYGFKVVGIQGMSTESEAGVRDVENLVQLLVEKNIGAVFVESTVSDRNVKALIEGAQARGHPVSIGGELFSDAMGKSGTYEGTYKGMIDHNVTTVTRALGGTVAGQGLYGALKHKE